MALLLATDPVISSPFTPLRNPTVPRPIAVTNSTPPPQYATQRTELKRIAAETLAVLKAGGYSVHTPRGDVDYDLRRKIREMQQRTRFYHPGDPRMVRWSAMTASTGMSTGRRESNASVGGGSGGGGASGFADGEDGASDRRGRHLPVYISVFAGTTLEAVQALLELEEQKAQSATGAVVPNSIGHIGVLSSGCPTHPGGNLLGGSNGQELALARATTLYASLLTDEAKKFYGLKASTKTPTQTQTQAKGAFPARTHAGQTPSAPINAPGIQTDSVLNTHGMLYSPGVTIFRDDLGRYVPPADIDVVTCAAVPAQAVRAKYGPVGKTDIGRGPARFQWPLLPAHQVEALIERTMRERMARVLALFLFARRGAGGGGGPGVRTLVLPAFGTGSFGNSPAVVARIWADLLAASDAPFRAAVERVVFAVPPWRVCEEFERVFGERPGVNGNYERGAQHIPERARGGSGMMSAWNPSVPLAMGDDEDRSSRAPPATNLEQYARAIGARTRSGQSTLANTMASSSQTAEGKGKWRATVEDVDDDSGDETEIGYVSAED